MKKIVKLVSSLLAVILILNCLCMSTLAATIPDPYHAILNAINKEYDLELGYVTVDPNTISVENYEKVTRETAEKQRTLLDRMTYRERRILAKPLSQEMMAASSSIITVTKTQNVWDLSAYQITLTYNYNESTHQCTSPRNASIGVNWILLPISNTSFL